MPRCASWLKMKVCKLYIALIYSFSKRQYSVDELWAAFCLSLYMQSQDPPLCVSLSRNRRGNQSQILNWGCIQSFASLVPHPPPSFPYLLGDQPAKLCRKNLASAYDKTIPESVATVNTSCSITLGSPNSASMNCLFRNSRRLPGGRPLGENLAQHVVINYKCNLWTFFVSMICVATFSVSP